MPARTTGTGVFLTDFGLAKDTATNSTFTRSGTAFGTLAYMSPEQARGDLGALTPASDVWALGCVLYELLAGRPAFDGPTPGAIMGLVLTGRPVSLARLRPDTPAWARQVVDACLTKAQGTRPGNASLLREDLARGLQGLRPRHRARVRRWRWLPAAAALAVSIGAIAVVVRRPATPAAGTESAPARLAARGWDLRGTDPAMGAELLGRALQDRPGRHDWAVRQGLLLWANRDAAGARAAWERVPRESPERPAARFYLGLEEWFRILGTSAPRTRARSYLAEAMRAQTRIGRLATAAVQCIDGRVPDGGPRLALEDGWEAALLLALTTPENAPGADERTVQAYDRALSAGVAFAWAFYNRGDLKRRQGKLQSALRDFDRALAIDSAYLRARVERGLVKLKLGDPQQAIRDFDSVLAVDPSRGTALINRGLAKRALGDSKGALADFSHALSIDPRDTATLLRRGSVRTDLADYSGAIADYDAALAIEPKSADALIGRGIARQRAGDLRGAIRDYDAALSVQPDYAPAFNNRGHAKQFLGDIQGALNDFDAALRIDPQFVSALLNRAASRMVIGKVHGALEDVESVLAIAPEHVGALFTRGVAKATLGDADGALRDYDQVVTLDPKNTMALLYRGVLHLEQRRFEPARADFARALESAPSDWAARATLERKLAEAEAGLGRKR